MKYCQSCGMPLEDEKMFGTNSDGTRNEKYCRYCYQEGEFTKDCTMQEMIDICVPIMVEDGNIKEEEARQMMEMFLPQLERWSK